MYTPEELLPVMIKLAEKYTSKDSSSISYERAEYLMDAVIYCISEVNLGPFIHQLSKTSDNLSPQEAYDIGLSVIKEKVATLTSHFNNLIKSFDDYGNENYHDTVTKGIPGFLLRYDPQFAPQENIITMDYPILIPPTNLRGINAIIHYVNCIDIEQRFLSIFPREKVIQILEEYHPDYVSLFDNISEIVMNKILSKMIPDSHWITSHNESEINDVLQNIWHRFIHEYFHEDLAIEQYYQSSIKDYAYRLKNTTLPV